MAQMMTENEQAARISEIQSKMATAFIGRMLLGLFCWFAEVRVDPSYRNKYFNLLSSQEAIITFYLALVILVLVLCFFYNRVVARQSPGWALAFFLIDIIFMPFGFQYYLKSPIFLLFIFCAFTQVSTDYYFWSMAKKAKQLKREKTEEFVQNRGKSQSSAYKEDAFKDHGETTRRKSTSFFNGKRDLENDAYQIYLSEKYQAKFNPLLGKYQYDQKLFVTLNELLAYLDEIDAAAPARGIYEDAETNTLNFDAEKWFYKAQNGYPVGPKSIRYIASLNQNAYFFIRHIDGGEDDFKPLFSVLAKLLTKSTSTKEPIYLQTLIEIYGVSTSFIKMVLLEREPTGSTSGWLHQNPMTRELTGSLPLRILLTYMGSEHELIKHPDLPEFVPLGIVRAIFHSHEKFSERYSSRQPNSSAERSDTHNPNQKASAKKTAQQQDYKASSEKLNQIDFLIETYNSRTGEFIIKILIGIAVVLLLSWFFWGRK